MTTTTLPQFKVLAAKCGWDTVEFTPGSGTWTHAFTKKADPAVTTHPNNVAVLWARFSPTGRLTLLEGIDCVANKRHAPTKFKTTALSHFLTEGLENY